MARRAYVDREVRIRHIIKKRQDSLEDAINLLCESLGVIGPRDVDNISVKIFKELLKALQEEKAMTSDELAEKVGLTRGAVVHHLNRMVKAGVVIRSSRGYEIRSYDLESLIDEVRTDVNRFLEDIKSIAMELDSVLNLKGIRK